MSIIIEEPKKPYSAWIFFGKELGNRPDLQGLDLARRAKKLQEEWYALSPEQRQRYEQRAQEAKAKYDQDLAEYNRIKNAYGDNGHKRKADSGFEVCRDEERTKYLKRMAQNLWSHRDSGDTEVVCGDCKWRAHAAVLAAASPALKAMVSTTMKESNERRIEFLDVEPDGVKAMLEFLHTGTLPQDADALSALKLAHMYEIPELLTCCIDAVIDSVSCSNVAFIMRTLRAFRDDEKIGQLYDTVRVAVAEDDSLLDAIVDCL
eukprot:gnl/MRDRNA2_/MRDRNA2_108758_c0_seq1.p1 gnl/MRDRNA2_/MRDRNA2_108758_c0~~gnl/MRDRNA2_/MRDRNA2_108758_c0_seq1.p1  ORF type:complete len:262 (-),score=54.34 gnl/MRDRNA2_/MRDRNA2_108758_c0_seq1:222-1007(-)